MRRGAVQAVLQRLYAWKNSRLLALLSPLPTYLFLSLVVPLGLAALAVAVAACVPPAAPPRGVGSAQLPVNFTTSSLVAPLGAALAEACTPTGPELCFNAIDDNCNGVIDEGCGLETGLLQFTIAWSAAAADVNLSLVAPGDDHVPNGHERATKSGFHLDRDCPGDEGCGGQNVENIYYDGSEPPHGAYVVEIALGELHGAESPVQVRFSARLGGRTVGFDVSLAPGDDAKKTFTFNVS